MNRTKTLLYTKLLAAALLTGATAFGGTFTANFATQDTSTFNLNGSGSLADGSAWMPTIETNRLHLTLNQNNLKGCFSPNDFDAGSQIQGFTAKFKLQFGPGTANAADGASFSFGPEVDPLTFYDAGGAGGTALAVSFDIYDNGGGEAPAIKVMVFGNQIGFAPFVKADMVTSQLEDVTIQLNRNSTLNVSYKGQVVFTNLFLPDWGPTTGIFNVSAMTGGENAETDLANFSIVTATYSTPVAPTVTAAPLGVAAAEGSSATFSVGFDGTGPFSFQWTKNGADILDATNQTLILTPVLYADNTAKIAVKITNPATTVTSAQATLAVSKDTTPPTVTKVAADLTFKAVLATFSEPVSDTALSASRYAIDQGVTISAVDRVNPETVKLTTSTLAEGKAYNLTINGVQDIATTPNTIAANTKAEFRSFVFVPGTVVHKKYDTVSDATGSTTDGLFTDARYPSVPDRTDLEPRWEYPPDGAGRVAADPVRNYFDTLEGYFIPPTTGDYVFFIVGADRFWLYLSTDESPANMHVITVEPGGWTNPRAWNTGQGGIDMAQLRSDSYASTEWPNANTISLQAGKRYYMLSVHHDPSWCGADDFAVTYKRAADADPADGDASTLTGSVVGFYLDPTGANVAFTEQPQNANALQGGTASFSAAATGTSVYGTTVFYQWQSAPKSSTTWTDISGATAASFKTPLLALTDNGMQFRLIATVPPLSATSSVATVTVSSDTTPPVVTVGAMQDSTAGTVDVGVAFNKPVDEASGKLLANYSVSSGTITSLTWYTNRFTANSKNPLVMIEKQSVLLQVTGLSGSGTLTVKNVSDTFGNKITSTNVPFTVDSKMKWGVVGANETGGWNAVVPVAASGFDVYSDGIGEWGNYDETTFVYEQVTGNFDKRVRVEYQDGSSTWARAGLVVRDVLNFGVDRATQAGSGATVAPYDGAAGRYQKCHVNPVGAELSGPGNPGNGNWEGNRRLDKGGNCTSASTLIAVPQYPNAWCRIQRVGQKFTLYRSDDGVTWITLGSTTWGVDDETKTPMPDTVYVGPEFSPENGNVTQAADQGTFLARFREYGDYAAVVDPKLKVGADTTGKVTITWAAGTLVSSSTVKGSYAPVASATSPYVVTPAAGATMFYQVKQ